MTKILPQRAWRSLIKDLFPEQIRRYRNASHPNLQNVEGDNWQREGCQKNRGWNGKIHEFMFVSLLASCE